MLVDFHHNVLAGPTGDELGTTCFRSVGGIGDYLVFLVVIQPLLLQYARWRRILAVDSYPGCGNRHPIEDICRASGLIEEVWVNSKGAGGQYLPKAVAVKLGSDSRVELWRPWPHNGDPPGVRSFPFCAMAKAVTRGEVSRRLIEPETQGSLVKQYPFMAGSYVTVQPYSSAKGMKWSFPVEVVRRLVAAIDCLVVVLRFPSSPDSYYQSLEGVLGVRVVDVEGMCRSISIQAHARCHIGVESSQLVVAALYDVPALFLHYPGGADGENAWLRMLGIRKGCQRADSLDDLVTAAVSMTQGKVA